MKERCPRQHRIGETCGAKLVHDESITRSAEKCRTCQEIEVKHRRLKKIRENIDRWRAEGDRFAASLEKAYRENTELTEKIQELHARRPVVATKNNGERSGLGSRPNDSVRGMPAFGGEPNTGSYAWSSTPPTYISTNQGAAYGSGGDFSVRGQTGYVNDVPSSRQTLQYAQSHNRRR